MNHELAKTLTTALVQFIDRERPEGKMCCSNTDCANLENAFNSENFVYVEAYIKMKLSGGLTEFESSLRQIIEETLSDEVPKWLKDDIARKELNAHTKGYYEGYKVAEKRYNESVTYHFPIMPGPPCGWGCDGTHCTNPHGDCIDCPRRFSSGGTITTPNTASGTSTLKAEG